MNLLWLDLESTGLDPERDKILEICAIVTNSKLKKIEQYSAVLPFPESEWEGLDPIVLEMHTKNNLLNLCNNLFEQTSKSHEYFLTGIENHILGLVDKYQLSTDDYKSPLCGSSIAFDKSLLKQSGVTRLLDKLHYRQIDVSTIMVLAELQGLTIDPPKYANHRASSDLNASIEKCKKYWNAIINSGIKLDV